MIQSGLIHTKPVGDDKKDTLNVHQSSSPLPYIESDKPDSMQMIQKPPPPQKILDKAPLTLSVY